MVLGSVKLYKTVIAGCSQMKVKEFIIGLINLNKFRSMQVYVRKIRTVLL